MGIGDIFAKITESKVKDFGEYQKETQRTPFEGGEGSKIKDSGEFAYRELKVFDTEKIKSHTIQQIAEENKSKLADVKEAIQQEEQRENNDSIECTSENAEKRGLSEEEKVKLKEMTGWSEGVINSIDSMEEAEIYIKAGLKEVEIGGKKCLIREDIDWEQIDEKGRTNKERIELGRAPLDKNGESIQLHHIGQHVDSPLAELTFEEHRCNGNDTILHDKNIETETHGEGNTWNSERETYWKERYVYNEGGIGSD